jgi:hypothetical protein
MLFDSLKLIDDEIMLLTFLFNLQRKDNTAPMRCLLVARRSSMRCLSQGLTVFSAIYNSEAYRTSLTVANGLMNMLG